MSCRLLVRLLLVATVIGVAPPPGRADVIVLSQIRSIEGTTFVTGGLADVFFHSAPSNDPWIISGVASSLADAASSTATAEQVSRVGPLAFSATGNALGAAVVDFADEEAEAQLVSSWYDVEFRLTTPYVFSWSSAVTASQSGGFHGITALVRFAGTDTLLFDDVASTSGSAASNGSGLLPQGEYSLFANAHTSIFAGAAFPRSSGAANYRFNLNLTPIPEPTTLALLGTGLGVMLFRNRIRR
jgi:hypothetical protein